MALVLSVCGTPYIAQLAPRPTDPLGLSPRIPRPPDAGAAADGCGKDSRGLVASDPWLAYALGHMIFQHEWSAKDGVFGSIPDRPAAAMTNSCALCHNQPFRSAGYGGNVPDPPGYGRSTPHLFGIGLLQTIGLQIRAEILNRYDLNKNGFLDVPSETSGRRARVQAAPGSIIDYGPLEDLNGDGLPGLNDAFVVWFVGPNGRPLPARADGRPMRMDDTEVAGYDFFLGTLSSSIGDHQFPTLRTFSIGAVQTIFGIQVSDSTVTADDGACGDLRVLDGWARPSVTGTPHPRYELVEDSRRPVVREEDLDYLEWFLTNHPAPAVGRQTPDSRLGRRLFKRFGCATCHTPDWVIRPHDPQTGDPGDPRFFDLAVSYNKDLQGLSARLHPLLTPVRLPNGRSTLSPARDGMRVRGIYSDLRHHDLGDRFYEYRILRGQLFATRRFRTTPLWGLGSTPPYGHDGRSETIDDVIRRHGGEAESAAHAYEEATSQNQLALLAFLRSLVLYQPDLLPADIDGDGVARDTFVLNGLAVGKERFAPEFLFRRPPSYRSLVCVATGDCYFSYELLNTSEAYAPLAAP